MNNVFLENVYTVQEHIEYTFECLCVNTFVHPPLDAANNAHHYLSMALFLMHVHSNEITTYEYRYKGHELYSSPQYYVYIHMYPAPYIIATNL